MYKIRKNRNTIVINIRQHSGLGYSIGADEGTRTHTPEGTRS
jgi:hypothetical protein